MPATAPVGLQAAPAGASPVVVDVDDGGVNDNGQTSGDIFTQNAQDQSTATGGNVTWPRHAQRGEGGPPTSRATPGKGVSGNCRQQSCRPPNATTARVDCASVGSAGHQLAQPVPPRFVHFVDQAKVGQRRQFGKHQHQVLTMPVVKIEIALQQLADITSPRLSCSATNRSPSSINGTRMLRTNSSGTRSRSTTPLGDPELVGDVLQAGALHALLEKQILATSWIRWRVLDLGLLTSGA